MEVGGDIIIISPIPAARAIVPGRAIEEAAERSALRLRTAAAREPAADLGGIALPMPPPALIKSTALAPNKVPVLVPERCAAAAPS